MDETNQLKNVGLKITTPRLKVLQLLETSSAHHLSAENIYKALLELGEEVSLATVYRVLSQFQAAGLVDRHNFEDGYSVFELRQDEHHDHLVCIVCGRVEEFLDDVIEARQHHIAEQSKYVMTAHALTIYGVCQPCQSNQAEKL